MAERPWITVSVAIIGAVGAVIAAWVGVAGRSDNHKEKTVEAGVAEARLSNSPSQDALGSPAAGENATQVKGDTSTPTSSARYDFRATHHEYSVFTDPLTGVVVGMEEISNAWHWGLAVRCRITFPETSSYGKRVYADPTLGATYDFTYKGRKFNLIIEGIDAKKKTATFRVLEL